MNINQNQILENLGNSLSKKSSKNLGKKFQIVLIGIATGLVSFTALTPESTAQNASGFKTPSGNIHCLQSNGRLRCELKQNTSKLKPKPRNCDLDWGNAFGMRLRGRGRRLCHGDTIQNPRYKTLGYGKTWKRGGFTCVSRTDALTCVNKDGNGWILSKGQQKFIVD